MAERRPYALLGPAPPLITCEGCRGLASVLGLSSVARRPERDRGERVQR